jgi:hypothetical protein
MAGPWMAQIINIDGRFGSSSREEDIQSRPRGGSYSDLSRESSGARTCFLVDPRLLGAVRKIDSAAFTK